MGVVSPTSPPPSPQVVHGSGNLSAVLRGGCSGFASNAMKWPEEILVAGGLGHTSLGWAELMTNVGEERGRSVQLRNGQEGNGRDV